MTCDEDERWLAAYPWRQYVGAWIRAVAPLAPGRPVYLLDAAEGEAAGIFFGETTIATTGPALALAAQGVLEAKGQWKGWGFCAVVNLARCASLDDLVAVGFHEAAHWAFDDALLQRFYADLSPAQLEQVLRADWMPSLPILTGQPGERAWSFHGPRFLRIVCHVAYRAQRLGWLGDANLIQGESNRCGLARASTYGEYLGDERAELRELALSEVVRTPAPAAYKRFAHDDLREAERNWRYLESLREEVKEEALCA